jgi:hypothetical protein
MLVQVITYIQYTSDLFYKCFTIINYDHNDSGQYYKTTITIIIYDPS